MNSQATDVQESPVRPKGRSKRPPLPEDYKELCTLCRAGKLFAVQEWFKRLIRGVLSQLSYMEAYEFIKLFVEQQVMPMDVLGQIPDTPKFRKHLHERRAALAALVPKLRKWVKAEERERRREQDKQSTLVRSLKSKMST